MDITQENKFEYINSVRIEQQQKIKYEYKLIGKMRRIAGLTLFSYNQETNILKHADVEKEVILHFDKKPRYRDKVKTEKNCIYFQALNIKNAKKKLERFGFIVKS